MRRSNIPLSIVLACGCGSEADPDAIRPTLASQALDGGQDPGQRPELALDCLERRRASRELLEAVVLENGGCGSDADCTLGSTSTACDQTCPVAVNRVGRFELGNAVHSVNGSYCNHYREDGCLVSTAFCLRVRAICVEHACVPVREPLCSGLCAPLVQ